MLGVGGRTVRDVRQAWVDSFGRAGQVFTTCFFWFHWSSPLGVRALKFALAFAVRELWGRKAKSQARLNAS
eukprot:7204265-Alexandrium_andersonii.AAC.1